MDYLKMIEFLTQEIVKRDDAVKKLTEDVDWQKSIVDRLTKLNDEHLGDLNIYKNELDSCCNQLRLCKEDLKEMTIEKDHWKAEALEYRNEREPEWWSKEEQYKEEIKSRKDTIVLLTKELDRMKTDKDYYEERIAKLQVEINHFKNNK